MKCLYIILALLFLSVPAVAATVEITATWTANTEADLAGYNLYYSAVSGDDDPNFLATFGKVSTGKVQVSMSPGETLYFRLTAFDTEGLESGFSNEASYRLPNTGEDRKPPKVPGGLGLTGRVL